MRRGMPPMPRMCIAKNVQLKAMKVRKKWMYAQRFVHHPAEHLGIPESDRGEDAEHRAAEQDVVNVGDDEVGVVDVDVDRRSRP